MTLGSFVQELKMTPYLHTFTLGLNFMAVSVARGGSDTDGHLNLEDQLDSAYYFRPNQCGFGGTCKAFLY